MPTDEKKGLTVKIDAGLHAEVKQYLEEHGMTMAEFVTLALNDELHPKYQQKEEKEMGNMRTLAFQVPEELFQRIKEYLHRNHMSQKEFVIGLIESELERDLAQRESESENESGLQADIPASEQEGEDQEATEQEEADQEEADQEATEQEEAGDYAEQDGAAAVSDFEAVSEDYAGEQDNAGFSAGFEAENAEDAEAEQDAGAGLDSEEESENEDENMGFSMGM